MPDITDTTTTKGTVAPASKKPVKFKVRKVVAGMDNHPVIYSSDNQTLAENYITANHPRGREVYLETPDGAKKHYSADHDFQGTDAWNDYSDDEDE
jgi:hypothetical protein